MTLAESKRHLRAATTARVLAMAADARRREETALHAAFDALPGLAPARTVLLFASALPDEFDTAPLLAAARAAGRALVLPRVDRAARRLRLHLVDDPATRLVRNRMNIPEPDDLCPEVDPARVDWALVPGVAFGRDGSRLGRGGGYYDRLLPTLRPDAPRWALAFSCQIYDHVPVGEFDTPISGVAGPGGPAAEAGPDAPGA